MGAVAANTKTLHGIKSGLDDNLEQATKPSTINNTAVSVGTGNSNPVTARPTLANARV